MQVCLFQDIENPFNSLDGITLEELTPTSKVVELACRHIFGEPGLRTWLAQNPRCPTCREVVDITSLEIAASTSYPTVHINEADENEGNSLRELAWACIISYVISLIILIASVCIGKYT